MSAEWSTGPDGPGMGLYGGDMQIVRRVTSILAVSVTGTVLIVAGAVMLVTPGPGLLAIVAGLAVWAREFRWARRLLDRTRARIAARLGRSSPATTIDLREASDPSPENAPGPSQTRVA